MINLFVSLIAIIIAAFVICLELIVRFAFIIAILMIGLVIFNISGII